VIFDEKKNSVGAPNFVIHITFFSFQPRHFSFSGKGFLNLTSVLLFFKLAGQIPSGSPNTNFWLLYTFKELNPMSDQRKLDFLESYHIQRNKNRKLMNHDDGPLQSPLIDILIDNQSNQ
jgi:hypothetical protein